MKRNVLHTLLLMVFLLGMLQPMHAQYNNRTIPNLPQVDLNRWHFGFILGIGMADFATKPSADYVDNEGYHYGSASAGLAPTFLVGMIADLRIVEYLNVRCTPLLTLGQRDIYYTRFNASGAQVGDMSKVAVKPCTVVIPFYFKYSAKRYGNFRPYILAGGGPEFNLNLNPEEPILLRPFDVNIGFGFGLTFYTEYFKFCPEFKFNFGLLDELNRNHPEVEGTPMQVYTSSVDRLTSRMFTITFNFE